MELLGCFRHPVSGFLCFLAYFGEVGREGAVQHVCPLSESRITSYNVCYTKLLRVALLLANLSNTVAEFAGWAAALEIFGVSRYISVPIGAVAVWFLVVKGTHRIVEKIFIIASTVYFTYAVSAYFAHPQWGSVARNLVTPVLHADSAYVVMLIGMVGTTIAPWMQFYLQSAVRNNFV